MAARKSPEEKLKAKLEAQKIEYVRTKILTNDAWLKRGLVAIYKYQTPYEQDARMTNDRNDVGFGAFDAEFLSAMAELVLNNANFSQRQIDCMRKGMKKYAGQLVRIAGDKLKISQTI